LARPQLKNGYVMICLDLFAVLLTAEFSSYDRVILVVVIAQTYGFQKRAAVDLDLPTIEHYTGIHRNNLRASVRRLTAWGVLKVDEHGRYSLAKDYETWTIKGTRIADRLAGGLIKLAGWILRTFGTGRNSSTETPIESHCVSCDEPNRNQLSSASTPMQSDCSNPPQGQLDPIGVTTGGGNAIQLSASIGTRARLDSENLERQDRESEGSPPTPRRASEVPVATVNGLDGEVPIVAEELNDPAAVDRVARLADELFPFREFGMQVGRYRNVWPIDWVERALIDLSKWTTPPRTYNAVVTRLQAWQRDGGPPPITASSDTVPYRRGTERQSVAEQKAQLRAAREREAADRQQSAQPGSVNRAG
jgi:hypothetical protein